jgi:anti-sigma B factor antagonist
LEEHVTHVRNGQALLLRPTGPLDTDSCGALRQKLATAFAAGISSVGVDLSGVTTVDPAGLGVLSGAARHLRKRGGNLVIVHASPEVLTTVRINGMSDLLEIQPAPALRLLSGAGSRSSAGSAMPGARTLRAVPGLKRPS